MPGQPPAWFMMDQGRRHPVGQNPGGRPVPPGGALPGGTGPRGTGPATGPRSTGPGGIAPGGIVVGRPGPGGAGRGPPVRLWYLVSRGPGPIPETRPAVRQNRLFAGSRHGGHSAFRREIEMITRPAMMISSTNTSSSSAAS